MKNSKKLLSIILVLLTVISLIQVSFILSFAVVKFESDDFEFAMVSDDRIEV